MDRGVPRIHLAFLGNPTSPSPFQVCPKATMGLVQDNEGGKLHVQHCHCGEGDQETTCDMHGLWTF